ncbi:MAG: MerR family transcriptional regulator [Thiobacillus sp.]
MNTDPVALPIASVERETGLSKDTLRVWERRYGFPAPTRDAKGERLYPLGQVRRLVQIKRLIDRGHRPGKLLTLDEGALAALDAPLDAERPEISTRHLDRWMHLVKTHDHEAMQALFRRDLFRCGMSRFVQDIAAPLIARVGDAWARNQIGLFEEHLFSQHLEKLFRSALSGLALNDGRPRVLLTTLSGEEHTLGLLMVEALLTVEDAYPVLLGPQTPVSEIVRAALAKEIDAVCLSFSSAYPVSLAKQGATELRRSLPADICIWAGGCGVKSLRKPPEGVCLIPEFADLFACLGAWRQTRQTGPLPRQGKHTESN